MQENQKNGQILKQGKNLLLRQKKRCAGFPHHEKQRNLEVRNFSNQNTLVLSLKRSREIALAETPEKLNALLKKEAEAEVGSLKVEKSKN